MAKENDDYKYVIGDWVQFSHTSEMYYNDKNQRVAFHSEVLDGENNIGQIVGAVKKHIGKYIAGHHPHYNPDSLDSPHLESDGTILFFLVRTGMLNKSKMIFPKYLTLLDPLYQKAERIKKEKHFKKFPWFDNGWGETTKRIVSGMMKGIKLPRDEKGRFV